MSPPSQLADHVRNHRAKTDETRSTKHCPKGTDGKVRCFTARIAHND